MLKIISAFIFVILFQISSFAELQVIAHPQIPQGQTFIAFLSQSQEVKSAVALYLGRTYPFYLCDEGFRAHIPTMPEEETGEFILTAQVVMKDESSSFCETPVNIVPLDYKRIDFYLPPAQKKLAKGRTMVDEWAIIEKALLKESSQKLWEGKFIKPVAGVTTMGFGVREYINKKYRNRHRGWDFRAPIGTKIRASNNGVVVLIDKFKAFGGTVVLDHGQGVFSLFFHLSKFLIKEGDYLEKGDVLGLTGNTGVSSGPHLHWGLSVHNVRVEPKSWVLTVMP